VPCRVHHELVGILRLLPLVALHQVIDSLEVVMHFFHVDLALLKGPLFLLEQNMELVVESLHHRGVRVYLLVQPLRLLSERPSEGVQVGLGVGVALLAGRKVSVS